ncbi:unnamed protein product, partial [Porites lobata]
KPNFVAAITRQTLPSTVVNVARERKEESHFLNGVIQGNTALITSAAAALGQQGNGTRLQIPSFSQQISACDNHCENRRCLIEEEVSKLFKIKCLLCLVAVTRRVNFLEAC